MEFFLKNDRVELVETGEIAQPVSKHSCQFIRLSTGAERLEEAKQRSQSLSIRASISCNPEFINFLRGAILATLSRASFDHEYDKMSLDGRTFSPNVMR
ncbi:MAG TPA: hypothetical protein VK641_17490 [Terriglobales bacterium]|nr:hypothetical protein [Terriglobales bacterium]